MVKNTCVCTTKEAKPGEIRPSIAKNKMPNCPTPIATPYAHILAQETLGLGIKNAKGKNAKV